MTAKPDPYAVAPDLTRNWTALGSAVTAKLDPVLAELVKIRASQLNRCANCINMHAAVARQNGETEQRIYLLAAWHDAPCYSPRERAALAWTEALNRLSEGGDHAAAYAAMEPLFSAEERVTLTLLINVINGWNRIAVGFGLWYGPDTIAALPQGRA